MYIERVVLRSIKGFHDLDLDLCPIRARHAGWAVITGDNGSGKTALLRAVSMAILGPEQTRSLTPDLRGWVSEWAGSGTISVEIRPDHDIDKTAKGGYPIRSTFWAEVELDRMASTPTLRPADVFRGKRKGAINGPWQEATSGWATLAYGPFRRLYGSSPDASRMMALPSRIPKFATLFKEDATLGEGERWLIDLNYKSLEGREQERSILEGLLRLVRADFLRQGVVVETVDSDGLWLRDHAGRRMSLEDMSDGYRSALAMLIDIYRHMVDIYGFEGLMEETNDNVTVSKPGVVLIDEVDAHLHPAWQREIGFWLTSHFPLVQFIVTTHSPIVAQAADSGRIYHLPSDSESEGFQLSPSDFQAIVAGKPDEILLTPAFGLKHTRSPRAVSARRRRATLIARQRGGQALTSEETEELAQLQLFVPEEEG